MYYDALNRLTGKHYRSDNNCPTNPTDQQQPVRWQYDLGSNGIGRRTGMSDATGQTTWAYDLRGQMISEQRNLGIRGTYTTAWGYNSAGLVNWMRYPSAAPGDPGEVLTYQYKNQLSLNSVVSNFPTAYVLNTYYDAAGRMLRRDQGNLGALTRRWEYHPWTEQGGRLKRLDSGYPANPWSLMEFSYTYDPVGNILQIDDRRNGYPLTQTFTYDALDRLTTARASGGMNGVGDYPQESYTYNPTTGNLASKAGVNYTYADAAHKHAVTGLSNGDAYGYDNNGNMTTRLVNEQDEWKYFTLGYDAENRMVQVSRGETAVASFGYDGDGQRILATENGNTTIYIGSHFERNLQSNEITRYYFAGSTRIAMRKGTAAAVFILGDHLGSAGILADGSGNIITPGGLQLYKPWGEARGTSSISLTKYLYTGQQRLSFGLDFYGARWYDSSLGRFAQADTITPLASQGTQALDRYAYVNNNPVRYKDPTGHDVGCAGIDASMCSPYHNPSSNLQIMLILGINAGNGQIPSMEGGASDYAYVPDPATQYQTLTEAKPVPDLIGLINTIAGPYAQANANAAAPDNVLVNVYIDGYQNSSTPTTWSYVPTTAVITNNSGGAYNPEYVNVGNSKTTLNGWVKPGESVRYNLNNDPTQVSLGESLSIETYGVTYAVAGGEDPAGGSRLSSANIIQDSLAYLFRMTFSSGAYGYVHSY